MNEKKKEEKKRKAQRGYNKVSSRETNPWKNISHERIMRLIWMCQSKGSKSH